MVSPHLPAPGPVPPRQLRVGDTERESAVQALSEHFAAGRLRKEEFDARLEAAMTARTYAELDALFPDLPPLYGATPVPVSGPATAPALRPAGVAARRLPMPPMALFVILALLALALEAPVLLIPLLWASHWFWRGRRPAHAPGLTFLPRSGRRD